MEQIMNFKNSFNKMNFSEILGKITIYIYFISFFIWTGGLKYSVWVGLIALMVKKFRYKERIEIGPKILAYSNIYIFIGTVLIDIITYKNTHHISAHDRYNVFLMYFVLINFIKNKVELDRLMMLFGISAIISYFGAIPNIKIFLKDPTFRVESFYDQMAFSHILATGSIFFLGISLFNSKGKKRLFYVLVYIFSIIMILLTQTRGAMLATGIAQILLIAYTIILKRKTKYLIVILIGVMIWGKDFRNGLINGFGHRIVGSSNEVRVLFWKASIYGFEKHPVIGVGFGGTGPLFEEYLVKAKKVEYIVSYYSGGVRGNSHNEYLAGLMRYGTVVGGYLIIYLLGLIPYVYFKNRNKISNEWNKYYVLLPFTFISFYISALTETVLVSKTGNIFIVSMGIMAIAINYSDKN